MTGNLKLQPTPYSDIPRLTLDIMALAFEA